MNEPERAPEVHVCLVSDQLLPNVIPVLMRHPVAVHLVVSREMEKKADLLNGFFQRQGFDCHPHRRAPDAGMQAIVQYAVETGQAVRARHPDLRVVLNATGGTKPMAMGFVVGLRGVADEVIYTDTAHGHLEYLDPPRPAQELVNVLDIPAYLASQGMAFRDALTAREAHVRTVEARAHLTRYLAENADRLAGKSGGLLSTLNGMVTRALSRHGEALENPRQVFNKPPRGLWKDTLLQIARHDLGQLENDREFVFKDAEAARYLGGIWLEEYAWLTARDVRLDDLAMGVEVEWMGDQVRGRPSNEFDVLAISRNRLLIIECKTLRFTGNQPKDQDIITKIDSLSSRVGGLFGTPLLLSAQPLSDSVKSRCREWGLAVREGARLRFLDADLRNWKAGGDLS